MKKKIQYHPLDVQQISAQTAQEHFPAGSRVLVGVDVAKRHFVAALCDAAGEAKLHVRFELPGQMHDLVQRLRELSDSGRTVEVVMEPTGTYGDTLRFHLQSHDIPVFRVNNKHVHDAAELFDGAPSKHDAKDASVIGWLHAQGRSRRWMPLDADRRDMRALVRQRDLYDDPLRRLISQMEPLLARHFPELEQLFDLSRRKTPYRLLEHFGSPAAIAATQAEPLGVLLRRYARRTKHDDVLALLRAARTTTGVPMQPQEVELVRSIASEVLRLMTLRKQVDDRIAEHCHQLEVLQAMRSCLGPVTAAVLFAYLGDPRTYSSAAAFEKAAGLNLVESSSGTNPHAADRASRRISKRGPGIVRKYLFLAAMRLVQTDPVARAWYQQRRAFQGGHKIKALIAIERKLCRALFHVAQGQPFDVNRLFDARRLPTMPEAQEAA